MTVFKEHDVVPLRAPLPDQQLSSGARGAILMVFTQAHPPSYEVEFLDAGGLTIALLTLPEQLLEIDATSGES